MFTTLKNYISLFRAMLMCQLSGGESLYGAVDADNSGKLNSGEFQNLVDTVEGREALNISQNEAHKIALTFAENLAAQSSEGVSLDGSQDNPMARKTVQMMLKLAGYDIGSEGVDGII